MDKQNPTFYKSSDKIWIDDEGVTIPRDRLKKSEKITDQNLAAICKQALAIQNKLIAFKQEVEERVQKIIDQRLKELESSKETKGNVTIYSFDRSFRLEVAISERIEFDDLGIQAAKEKLDEFLNASIEGDQMVKELVLSAFTKSRGKLDTKKVLSLLKYRDKVSDPRFSKALDLIEDSIRKPHSKKYQRFAIRDENGEYQNIDLNYASVGS
jgi:hypothetical protein